MESEACTNFYALRLWAAACGTPIPPCEDASGDSVRALVQAFAGRDDIPPRVLAGLLLAADLRPDDRLWSEGQAPVWLPRALSLTAGRADALDTATVLVAESLPDILPATIRRVILTGGLSGQGAAPPGVTVTQSADWA